MQIVDEIITAVSKSGMDTASVRAIRKRMSKKVAELDRALVLEAAYELIERPPFGRFIAFELVRFHAATLQRINLAEVEALGRGISSWADVDTFAIYVSGPAWSHGRITDAAVKRWAKSADRWWRRAALVSTVPSSSAIRTLPICEMLLRDRDDMVVKAMSWALRALAKCEPKETKRFLDAHRDELAARVLREVGNKLTTGLKNPRKHVTH